MNRRHVDEKTARQRDVARDARALFAEGFLGDLDDDILAGLQHFGNELGTARRAGAATLIPTVMPGATGPAFETWATPGASTAIGAPATAVRAATAAIRASATAISTTVASTAAERPLEARTRIAADARGVSREVLTRSRWAADAGSTSFAGKQNQVFLDNCGAFRNRFAGGCRDHFLFEVLRLNMLRLDIALLGGFKVAMLGLVMLLLAMGGVVLGVFLSHVRGEFRAVGGAAGFHLLGFFLGEFRNSGDYCFFRFVRLLFCFFFVEFGAADNGIGFRHFRGFFVLGLDKARGKRGDLIFV